MHASQMIFMDTNKKLSAQRQIDAAIEHLGFVGVECAITLAGAAEGLLPDTENPHVFQWLKQRPEFKKVDVNATINWLKHPRSPDSKVIYVHEAALTVVRAMAKFVAVYEEVPSGWDEFIKKYFPGAPALKDKE